MKIRMGLVWIVLLFLGLVFSAEYVFAWNLKEPINSISSGNPGGGSVNARMWGGNDGEVLLGANGSTDMNDQKTLYVSPSTAGLFSDRYNEPRAEIRIDGSGTSSIATMKSAAGARIDATSTGDIVITIP